MRQHQLVLLDQLLELGLLGLEITDQLFEFSSSLTHYGFPCLSSKLPRP